ncbi:L-aspartate oxidase [Candidatus Cerribacteria bacterium 'Amazon FNV 2010 28 9']|uniref:L-aspartate oxidase n=1 Tax=Candidatus Cerribacteria bacterium 'Amazon FNV 2010 28 9' TaxID=2081795 RepID=A0A317JSG9_9BACT|nr:MAG: L-aspartate oxidase [Candidatus Cerribacteria bacterium 'Amazon FNV 2010 28 9']
MLESDVLIIGGGIAGGTTALRLADEGYNVVMLTRAKETVESNTRYAQGGIIYKGEDDTPELLQEDIEIAGGFHSNPEAARILATEGPARVQEFLIQYVGVEFDKTTDGELALALEGGHSLPRIVHAADTTGRAIEEALVEKLYQHTNITILPQMTAIDLLTPAHHSTNRQRIYEPLSCVGAYVFDQQTGEVRTIIANQTVLATGGLGQIYTYTTNPYGSRGDGIAMANRAGARTANLEYIQFHPTALVQRDAPRFLISEAVRGAGARLVHADGTPFMDKYDPQRKDLSTRDIVARAIYNEMILSSATNMYLDVSNYVNHDEIMHHFPSIYENCLQYGIDITKDPIPVAPAAHYSCGGVWTDMNGKTSIDRLYAVGEVACTGLHGANRLASTSLLEGLVFGYRAAEDIASHIQETSYPAVDEIPDWVDQGEHEADPALIAQDLMTLRSIMWNYVGLVRKTDLLERALRDLANLEHEIERFYQTAKLSDELIGLRNMARTSRLVTEQAWANKHSLGSHYRE